MTRAGRFSLSVACYRALLFVYPPEFREKFAGDLCADFADMLGVAVATRPLRGRVRCWRIALQDLRTSASNEWLARRRARRSARLPVPPRRGDNPMRTLIADLKLAVRSLVKSPAFALVTVITLALGIGANTAMFSVVNAVMLRPFPYHDADRLVMLFEGIPRAELPKIGFSAADFRDYARAQRSFDGLAMFLTQAAELSGEGEPERIIAGRMASSTFPVLGVTPLLGRTFADAEDTPESNVVVLGHGLWQRRFGGQRGVIGRTVIIDRRARTIIGVMPPFFLFPQRFPAYGVEPAELWMPLSLSPFEQEIRGGTFNKGVIGRLKPNATIDQARAELPPIARAIQETYPAAIRTGPYRLELSAFPLRDEVVGSLERPLLVLLAAVAAVLLVACGNVANLVLSRAASRERELGVRTALGASRGRLAQGLLAEGLVVAAAGGALGVLLAWWIARSATAWLPATFPIDGGIPIDARVLWFTAALSLATALFFGLAPVLAIGRVDASAVLRDSTTRTTAGGRRLRIQNALVVGTVGLAIVLLVSAGLLIRSFANLLAADPGFRPDRILTMTISLPNQGYPMVEAIKAFFDTLYERVRYLPGVTHASLSTDIPLSVYERRAFTPDAPVAGEAEPSVVVTWTVGTYFATMGVPLKAGRGFDGSELATTEQVVIVSENLAKRYWPDGSAVGKRLKWGVRESRAPWLTIVGVAGNVTDGPVGSTPALHVYQPYSQMDAEDIASSPGPWGRTMVLAVHTPLEPTAMTSAVVSQVRALDRSLAVSGITTMEQQLGATIAPQRLSMALLSGFAGVALLLAAIGIYGVLTLAVAQRTREIGVRLALGAQRTEVIRLVVWRGLRLALFGLALGIPAALTASRLLAALLYGTPPNDPVIFIAAPLVLILVAGFACYLPAHRASRLDPIQSLRVE